MGNFDKVIRENLGGLSKQLLKGFVPVEVKRIIPMPPKLRKTVIEREVDNLFLINPVAPPDFILHLEFQSTNDSIMPLRTAVYNYMARYTYGLEVVSIVIYVGRKRMRMDNSLTSSNGNVFTFKLVDIRDMDPSLFLASRNPKEVILAILAGKDEKRRKVIIKEIINKLPKLTKSGSRLSELLEQLEIVSLLRGRELQKLVIKQKENMPIVIDIREDLRFRQGKKEGKIEGISEGMERGLKQATTERNTAFVQNLLQHTTHSIDQIATLVNVPAEFVIRVKRALSNE